MSRMTYLPGPEAVPKSAATVVGSTIYTSGHVGQDVGTGEIPAAFGTQMRLAMHNLTQVLERAGGGVETIAKIQIFLVNRENLNEMNEIYREWIAAPRPARSTIVTDLVDPSLLFEIEAVAQVREI